jgi:hypothetical protein
MSGDEWTKVGVIGTIIGVIVGAICGTLVPLYFRWQDRRLRLDVRFKATLKSGLLWATRPDDKVDPRMRLAIEATIINRGREPVFLRSAVLKSRTGSTSLSFLNEEDRRTEFRPGDKWERTMELGLPGPQPEHEESHRRFQEKLLNDICTDGGYLEITTGDERAYRRWAKDVCDKDFRLWPDLLKHVREFKTVGKLNSPLS